MSIFQQIKKALQIRVPWQRNRIRRVASFWQKGGADFGYYQAAENEAWVNTFWAADSPFFRLFQHLDLDSVLEIASGTGRHSWQAIGRMGSLTLLDTSEAALELAKKRFQDHPGTRYVLAPSGNGMADCMQLPGVFSAIFSFDAMVHFEPESVQAYLRDAWQALRPGGRALFHHSNYREHPGRDFARNPGWRNHMNMELFNAYAAEAGFTVLEQQTISFVSDASDGLTLLEKSKAQRSSGTVT